MQDDIHARDANRHANAGTRRGLCAQAAKARESHTAGKCKPCCRLVLIFDKERRQIAVRVLALLQVHWISVAIKTLQTKEGRVTLPEAIEARLRIVLARECA